MKKNTLSFVVLLLLTMSLPAMGQEAEKKQTFFAGGSYDESVVTLNAGYMVPLIGNLRQFTYTTIGEYGSLSSELGYMIDFGRIQVTPLAGVNADWLEPNKDMSVLNYIVGSSGAIISTGFSENFGVWGYGKYKFAFVDDVLYPDGVIFGAGFYLRL